MNKATLAAIACTALALSACSRGNEDQLNQSELNASATENLDELSNEAANVAAEAQVLENQTNQLEQQTQPDNAPGAKTREDENIQGM